VLAETAPRKTTPGTFSHQTDTAAAAIRPAFPPLTPPRNT